MPEQLEVQIKTTEVQFLIIKNSEIVDFICKEEDNEFIEKVKIHMKEKYGDDILIVEMNKQLSRSKVFGIAIIQLNNQEKC